MKTKYIRMGHNMLIFPDYMIHSEVAQPYLNKGCLIHSAGFLYVDTNKDGDITVECYGESISLDKASRKDDYKLAEKVLGFRYDY